MISTLIKYKKEDWLTMKDLKEMSQSKYSDRTRKKYDRLYKKYLKKYVKSIDNQ